MGGASTVQCYSGEGCGSLGVFGILGTPSASNIPSGRSEAVSWTDAKGNFWLFGGWGFDGTGGYGYLNDLWKFDPSVDQWTWMGGSESTPCQYCGAAGQYGAFGTPASGNVPGGRAQAATWTDSSSNLWLFGGIGYDSTGLQCDLNDLWEFTPSANEWAWKGGSKFCFGIDAGLPGVYGTLGVPAVGNLPWDLRSPSTWTDNNGNLWLFGGLAEDLNQISYDMNDMWEFNPSINEWAWTSANSGGTATFGTMGNWSPGNIAGPRDAAANWTDNQGNFWLFGGSGAMPSGFGLLNDFWGFKPSINEWAWMGGSTSFNQPGAYGTIGSSAPANIPGARSYPTTWTDSSGNLWMFGGSGYDSQGTQGYLNDLWQYGINGQPLLRPAAAATPSFSLAAGIYTSPQTLPISDLTAGATIYYTTNGTVPSSNSTVYNVPITISSSETVQAIAVASGYSISNTASASYAVNLPQVAVPTFSVPAGAYSASQIVSMSDATAGATIYYTRNGATPTTSSTLYTGPITVSTSETIQAIAAATGYSASAIASATYTINLPPNFALAESVSALTIASGGHGSVTLTVTPQNGFTSAVSFACSGMPSGASCVFSPATVTPATGTSTTTLTISAAAQSAALRKRSQAFPPELALLVALGICGFRKRRNLQTTFLLVVVLSGLSFLAACGGGGGGGTGSGGGGGGSSPTVSTVTVTATSGTLQQSVKLTLTVN